jgi:tetraacyldisaccharide-1-P 4'-kinase
VVDQLILPDHDPYREPTMTRLMRLIQDSPGHDDRGREDGSRVDALVTTEKDWSKLNSPNRRFPCPVVRGDLLIEFSTGRDELSGALCNAVSRPEHRTSGALGCRNARTG